MFTHWLRALSHNCYGLYNEPMLACFGGIWGVMHPTYTNCYRFCNPFYVVEGGIFDGLFDLTQKGMADELKWLHKAPQIASLLARDKSCGLPQLHTVTEHNDIAGLSKHLSQVGIVCLSRARP